MSASDDDGHDETLQQKAYFFASIIGCPSSPHPTDPEDKQSESDCAEELPSRFLHTKSPRAVELDGPRPTPFAPTVHRVLDDLSSELPSTNLRTSGQVISVQFSVHSRHAKLGQ